MRALGSRRVMTVLYAEWGNVRGECWCEGRRSEVGGVDTGLWGGGVVSMIFRGDEGGV